MENFEVIREVLRRRSCQTAERIAGTARQMFQFEISPSQVAGCMRSLVARGLASSSKDENGKTVYWIQEDKD